MQTWDLWPRPNKVRLRGLGRDIVQSRYPRCGCRPRDSQFFKPPHRAPSPRVLLHVALESAVKWQLVQRNVADSVDAPKYRPKEMRTFGQESMLEFLESVRATEYYPVFYTALFTGMRRSELLALRWSDLDLDLGVI